MWPRNCHLGTAKTDAQHSVDVFIFGIYFITSHQVVHSGEKLLTHPQLSNATHQKISRQTRRSPVPTILQNNTIHYWSITGAYQPILNNKSKPYARYLLQQNYNTQSTWNTYDQETIFAYRSTLQILYIIKQMLSKALLTILKGYSYQWSVGSNQHFCGLKTTSDIVTCVLLKKKYRRVEILDGPYDLRFVMTWSFGHYVTATCI